MKHYPAIVASLFVLLALTSVLSRSDNQDGTSVYPVSNFQASLTASQFSTIAATIHSYDDETDYAIIISHSPSSSEPNFNLTRSCLDIQKNEMMKSKDHETVAFLTPIHTRGPVRKTFLQPGTGIESKNLHILHEQVGICLAMTGFSSDVKHLVRSVANAVSEHEYLYAGELPSIHNLVRNTLASQIRDATIGGGSRPFGVQALMVGNDEGNGFHHNNLQAFSLDPSGNFRHCIGGVAVIGKGATTLKQSLYNALVKNRAVKEANSIHDSICHNIDIVMECMLQSLLDESTLDSLNAHQFEAVIIFGHRKQLEKACTSCAFFNTDFIVESVGRCKESVLANHKLKP